MPQCHNFDIIACTGMLLRVGISHALLIVTVMQLNRSETGLSILSDVLFLAAPVAVAAAQLSCASSSAGTCAETGNVSSAAD